MSQDLSETAKKNIKCDVIWTGFKPEISLNYKMTATVTTSYLLGPGIEYHSLKRSRF